ncbi:hypothetical protein D3C72_1760660 [compost metagenome]
MELLAQLKRQLKSEPLLIRSDAKPGYQPIVSKVFPTVSYEQYPSRGNKEKNREQMYLKKEKRKYDPIFPLNQRCAVLRDHVKRLARRSWCATKIANNLELGLYLLIANHNQYKLF